MSLPMPKYPTYKQTPAKKDRVVPAAKSVNTPRPHATTTDPFADTDDVVDQAEVLNRRNRKDDDSESRRGSIGIFIDY